MLPQRQLGAGGPSVSAIGYGAMVLEGYYGDVDDTSAVATLRHALDVGTTFLDTADAYGNGHNEQLLAQALVGRRDQAFIATKFGIVFDPADAGVDVPTNWGFSLRINGTPAYARAALDRSLHRLGTDHVDLWYAHYPDPQTPIEETVAAMAEAVRAGKTRLIGLSNVDAEQVRRAHAVHPIAAVQYEYSLWRREVETDLLPTLRELGVALVPWSPLGSGFLTGTVTEQPTDFRASNPRYQGENFIANSRRFAFLRNLATALEITPAQLALAWLLHQGPDVVPIPGTRTPARIDENAAAATIRLRPEVLQRVCEAAPRGSTRGETLL